MNYNDKMKEILATLKTKPRLLIHSCCGPCSSAVISRLINYFNITILYYNPNIYPYEEYKKRLKYQKEIIKKMGLINEVEIIEGTYDSSIYDKEIIGHETDKEGSVRCYKCFYLRLEETCKYAKQNNYNFFTTTLSVSPHKNSKIINEIGEQLMNKYKINYLFADFKKENGYLRSIELSKKYDIYRQDYCGCIYSKNENKSVV